MTVATSKQSQGFTKAAKESLDVGKELTEGGLIWRKRKDGTGTWRYDFVQNGKRYKGVVGSEKDGVTLSQARAVISKIKAQVVVEGMKRQTGASFQDVRLFSDVADDYLKWSKNHLRDHRHNESRLKNHLLPHLGKRKLGDISTATVEDLRSDLMCQGLTRQTVKRVTSLLSSVYEFARKSDPELTNPTCNLSRMKIQEKDVDVFTREETERLLLHGAQSTRDEVLVGLALFAGLRASEALGLAWDQVDLDRDEIIISQTAQDGRLQEMTKSYKVRVVPISKSLKPILKAHREVNEGHQLVLSEDGVKPYYQVQRIFDRIKKRSGVDTKATYHGLRHTFASRVVEKSVDLPTLQRWMGHSDIKVTMRYVHSNSDHMKRMAAQLD